VSSSSDNKTLWPHLDAACRSAGALDADLPETIAMINAHLQMITAARTAAAPSHLSIGQQVRLNQRAKPNYLRGETETVHELYGDNVVDLARPCHRATRLTPRSVRSWEVELLADT
jgi:hypothetical protein